MPRAEATPPNAGAPDVHASGVFILSLIHIYAQGRSNGYRLMLGTRTVQHSHLDYDSKGGMIGRCV